MALINSNTTQTSISGLNYNSILRDIYSALKDSEEYNQVVTDFTSAEGTRLFAEMYAYVADQLANRIDVIGKDLFVDTASASALTRLLKLVSYKLAFPSASSVDVNIVTQNNSGTEITLSPGFDSDTKDRSKLNPASNSFKGFSSNNNIYFEFINYDDINEKFDYITPVKWTTPNNNQKTVRMFEGRTGYRSYNISSTGKNTIILDNSIIRNSVAIYFRDKKQNEQRYDAVELKQVDSFFSREALTSDVACYTIRNMGNGRCEITLQPKTDDLNKEILVFYRVGGGNYSIPAGSVDKTERIVLNNGFISVRYKNSKVGFGGEDELTVDEIKEKISGEIRAPYVATTAEDYEYLLPRLDSKIKFAKVFGEGSENYEDLCKVYGYASNPLYIWALVMKESQDLNEIMHSISNDVQNVTDDINDYCFAILDKNPRFNEKYQVKAASINHLITADELKTYFSINNASYSIPLTAEASDVLNKRDARIIVTKKPYIESGDSNTNGVNAFVNTDCLYDNLKLADGTTSRNYVQQNDETASSFESIYSSAGTAFATQESNGSISLSTGANFKITIDGVEYDIELSAGTYTFEDLAGLINSQITSVSFIYVLREGINSDIWGASSATTYKFNSIKKYTGETSFNITLDEVPTPIIFNHTGSVDDTFSSIATEINDKFSDVGYSDTIKAVYYQYEAGCWRLALVSSIPFDYSETTPLYFKNQFLAQDDNGNASSGSAYATDAEEDWPVADIDSVATVEDGKLKLDFPAGADEMSLSGNDIIMRLFQTESGVSRRQFREISCTYNVIGSSLEILVSSKNDQITDDIYINVFGSTERTIELGSYYANRNDIFKRDQIKNLYSTKHFENESVDEYGSDYQLKFTSNNIGSLSYEEIDTIGDKAKIKINPNFDDSPIVDGKLSVRVNSIRRMTDPDHFIVDGQTIIFEHDANGFLSFNVGTLYHSKVSSIFDALLNENVFGDVLEIIEGDNGEKYLATKEDDFKASIDFTGTKDEVLQYLFGGVRCVVGNTRRIDLEQIKRGSIQIAKTGYASNKNVNVRIDNLPEREVSTGSNIEAFATNLTNAGFGDYIELVERTFYFKNLTRNMEFTLDFKFENTQARESGRRMFVDSSNLEDVMVGDSPSIRYHWKNEGDYYIEHDTSGNVPYKLHVENVDVFPYGNIFFHMFEDYTFDHVVSVGTNDVPRYTDEYIWASLLAKNSPMMIEYVFNQPKFDTFDLKVECFVPDTVGVAALPKYKEDVSLYLREKYDAFNSKIGKQLTVGDIILDIRKNVPGIEDAAVIYFGKELSKSKTSTNTIECAFNHKLILSSPVFVEERYVDAYGNVKTKSVQTHGLIVDVKYS